MVYQGKILGSASLPPIISSRGESDSGGMLKQVTATLWARNQDVDFGMLEMIFTFQCTKYEKNRWLNTKLLKKKRRDSPKKTIRLFCTIVTHSVLLRYTAIGHF